MLFIECIQMSRNVHFPLVLLLLIHRECSCHVYSGMWQAILAEMDSLGPATMLAPSQPYLGFWGPLGTAAMVLL